MAEGKKTKYIEDVHKWICQETCTFNEVQELYGKLLCTCHIVLGRQVYLTRLEAMLHLCDDYPFKSYSHPKGLQDDINWWINILGQLVISRPIPRPISLYDAGVFSDASSNIRTGIIIGGHWRAWRLIPGWKLLNGVKDIGWEEAIGFKLLARSLIHLSSGLEALHFIINGDNIEVVEGWWNGRSQNGAVNKVFQQIHTLLKSHRNQHSLHTIYVQSKSNPADRLSRGIYPLTALFLPPVCLPAELENLIIDSQEPLTPIDEKCHQEGRYPSPATKVIDNVDKCNQASSRYLINVSSELLPQFSEHIWGDRLPNEV